MAFEGLDDQSQKIEHLQKVVGTIETHIAKIGFAPADAESVKEAITQMERAVDQWVRGHDGDATVGPFVDHLKNTYRKAIFEQAAAGHTTCSPVTPTAASSRTV
ncbi:hypothetical protein [Sphingobium sp.]|uniref:hypothetical protein n=1 Tax=Sphingobium sp. TaxID=1912891 RepID=UPI003BB5C356